ncbi:MAG: rhodanese-like domain-containing protein [Actinomycetota bacterium]
MPTEIHDVAELQKLIADGAQLVEVLPSGEYEEEHIAGAINIPLKSLNAETARRLDSARPVIVYCWDEA